MPQQSPTPTLTNRIKLSAYAALLCGLLLRIVFVYFHPKWGGDTLVYGNLADNMLRHHVFGFSEETIRPTLIRLPGYPIFLAVCFVIFGHANYLAVVCVQTLIDLLGCVLLGILATRIWSPRAGLITLWLAALCPFTASYVGAALTETWSIFCVTLALFALERIITYWRAGKFSLGWSLIAGLACAYAVLVRPDHGLVAAAIIPAILWLTFSTPNRSFTQRLLPAATATLVVLIPLFLWGVRNWRVFHVIQPLAPRYANDPGETVPFGFQRWFRTWGIDFKSTYDVYWSYDGSAILLKDVPPRAFDTPAQRAETATLLDQYNVEQSGTPAFDAAFARIAAARIAAHPFSYYVLLPIAREANMWLRPRTELLRLPIDWWNIRAHVGKSIFEIVYALLDITYLALAILGLVRWRKIHWSGQPILAASMIAFVALRCALLLTLDNSEPRYTLECFPIVILLAGFALSFGRSVEFRSHE
jgi:4-amino-4-deoxy-L-arabinose transferase-like glycosyltransferase